MKKFFLFGTLAFVFWTCSTELDIIDDWKETTVIYGLLDQSQPKQYIRIEKAFLGPDNALGMAQQFDSINYINALSVWIQERDQNGNMVTAWQLNPDTLTNKEPGIFAFPAQVVYSMNTPAFNMSHRYHLVVTNNQTGNVAEGETSLINNFAITSPIGNSMQIVKINSTSMVHIGWNGAANARVYQLGLIFHYKEIDLVGDTLYKSTPEWTIGTVKTTASSSTSPQEITFDPNSFYRFISSCIFDDPNIVGRKDDYIELTVYAGSEDLQTYMDVNGPSSSLVQDRPVYTNVTNGLGIFSARSHQTKTNITLTPLTRDTLSKGQFTCGLRFMDRNNIISAGCQ